MDEDPELAAIRAQRLANMQAMQGGNTEQAKKQEENAIKMEEMKNAMLTQILDQSARARLNGIALVKPEKARAVENMLIQMSRTGQIQGKLGESLLKDILERVSKQEADAKKKVTIERKRYAMDSDDDDY